MIIRKRTAQASIEFLTTYGWVMIIVLAAIAVLVNYGFLNPSKYLPERVEFSEQLRCEEYFLDFDAYNEEGIVALRLRNNFARPIDITDLQVKVGEEDYVDCGIQTVGDINIGEAITVACNNLNLKENSKNNLKFIATFRRNTTTAVKHNVSGLVFAEPVSGEYCNLWNEEQAENMHCDDNVQDCGEFDIDQAASCGDIVP